MGVFIGSEALAAGKVTRNDLRRHYTRLFPDVYGPPRPDLFDRAKGAWLWSGRGGVISGVAASGLHGAKYVDTEDPIDMLWTNRRPPDGVVVHSDAIAADEIVVLNGIPVATRARTVFDLGRHLPHAEAVARIDALLNRGRVTVDEVAALIARYPMARGLPELTAALAASDGGAESPQETRIRLLLAGAGMAPDETQIVVLAGSRVIARIDMGWEGLRVGVQYDGIDHQISREQYVRDQKVLRDLQARNWIIIKVIKEDRDEDVLARVATALFARGWRGQLTLRRPA